ncbi:MAG: hypothetical protein KF788_15380 [Piscinibacter sp.]|nr:hypothetical protein [Piscinibacter sp.]
MQSWYAERFEREMGCTEDELLRWLPGAVQGRPTRLQPGAATVAIGAGRLHLRWHALPARHIALLAMPRLAIDFAFEAVDEAERQRFMRHFDLYTQRGGG